MRSPTDEMVACLASECGENGARMIERDAMSMRGAVHGGRADLSLAACGATAEARGQRDETAPGAGRARGRAAAR